MKKKEVCRIVAPLPRYVFAGLQISAGDLHSREFFLYIVFYNSPIISVISNDPHFSIIDRNGVEKRSCNTVKCTSKEAVKHFTVIPVLYIQKFGAD